MLKQTPHVIFKSDHFRSKKASFYPYPLVNFSISAFFPENNLRLSCGSKTFIRVSHADKKKTMQKILEGCEIIFFLATLRTLELTRNDFVVLLGPVEDIFKKRAKKYLSQSHHAKEDQVQTNIVCELHDLKELGVLGKIFKFRVSFTTTGTDKLLVKS